MEITIREIFALAAFTAGIVFGTAGIAGLFRFPDPYARLQAGSLCGTTSVFSIFIGTLFLAPNGAMAARIIIIALFFLLSAPTGSHIVARFAWNSGLQPAKPAARRTAASRQHPPGRNADVSESSEGSAEKNAIAEIKQKRRKILQKNKQEEKP